MGLHPKGMGMVQGPVVDKVACNSRAMAPGNPGSADFVPLAVRVHSCADSRLQRRCKEGNEADCQVEFQECIHTDLTGCSTSTEPKDSAFPAEGWVVSDDA